MRFRRTLDRAQIQPGAIAAMDHVVAPLGLPSANTAAGKKFMRTLGPAVAQRFDQKAAPIAALPSVISR